MDLHFKRQAFRKMNRETSGNRESRIVAESAYLETRWRIKRQDLYGSSDCAPSYISLYPWKFPARSRGSKKASTRASQAPSELVLNQRGRSFNPHFFPLHQALILLSLNSVPLNPIWLLLGFGRGEFYHNSDV